MEIKIGLYKYFILMGIIIFLSSCRTQKFLNADFPIILTTLSKCPKWVTCSNDGRKRGSQSRFCEDFVEITFTSDTTFYKWEKAEDSIYYVYGKWLFENDKIVFYDLKPESSAKDFYEIFLFDEYHLMDVEDNYLFVKKWWQKSIRKKCK